MSKHTNNCVNKRIPLSFFACPCVPVASPAFAADTQVRVCDNLNILADLNIGGTRSRHWKVRFSAEKK